MNYKKREDCRVCGDTQLNIVLDLGSIYPSTFHEDDLPDDYEPVPLTLVQCQRCKLVQLLHTLDRDTMYRQYWYKSGLNDSMVRDLKHVVRGIEKRIPLLPGDIVIDIGCNDGTLLNLYTEKDNLIKIGFDPAKNLKEDAEKHCDIFINDYFSKDSRVPKKAKVITSIAMFYDLDDPLTFIYDVCELLDEDGIWVVQLTDLQSMLAINAFDNICHEHLEYYTLEYLIRLVNIVGLEVFDVSYNKVNGGSLRAYICHAGTRESGNVTHFLAKETEFFKENPVNEFKDRIDEIQKIVKAFLNKCYVEGDMVAVMGASTKGNTLLQYFGLDNKLIHHAAEINSDKFGKKTVGTEIPIISQEESFEIYPSLYMVLPWHFIDNFIKKSMAYLERGGMLFVPMPEPRLYYLSVTGEIRWMLVRNLLDF